MAARGLAGCGVLARSRASPCLLRGPQVLARRGLGDTVVGPPLTDLRGQLKHAQNFFKGARSYGEFKQQCVSIRLFAFGGVTAGCAFALFWDPPKSSYWQRWGPTWLYSHLKNCFSKSSSPLFLTESSNTKTDVPALVQKITQPDLSDKKNEPTAKANNQRKFKVCVCGGAGGIGQPLSMLMAMDDRVGELSVFDLNIAMVPAEGVAADLSHLEKPSKVKAYSLDKDDKPIEKLSECLAGCDLVLVPAGLPRKPGMTRADLLGINAGIAKNIVEACAKHCPNAVVGLIVNPVNSVVPAMAELYQKKGLDPKKIVGVTTLDVVRANKFVSEATGVPLEEIDVPVVGGHAGETILPLFSHVEACNKIPADKLNELDKRVQDAGTEVVNAKKGKGSATLSMAYAGARLGKAVLSGLSGEKGVQECAYVASSVSDLPYFASRVTFGLNGVEKVHPLGSLSAHEKERLTAVKKQLAGEIESGVQYANANKLA